MFTLDSFHRLCADGNLSSIKLFDDIPKLYEELENNGLFWSIVFGQFHVARYLLDEGIFNPDDLICGEIHILHILATLGGRDNEILKPMNQYYYLFRYYFVNNEYAPEVVDHNGVLHIEPYNKKEVLDFTKYIIDKYTVNVSVKTNKKWWNIENSQAADWLDFYQTNITHISNSLNLNYNLVSFTPLHLSLLFGYSDMSRLFVESGCDILCLGCKEVCVKCPYAIRTFMKDSDLDTLLDEVFDIGYSDEEIYEITEKNIKNEVELHWEYIFNEMLWILIEDNLNINAYSLEYKIMDKVSKCVARGIHVNRFCELPTVITKNIKAFMNYKYYNIPKKIVISSRKNIRS